MARRATRDCARRAGSGPARPLIRAREAAHAGPVLQEAISAPLSCAAEISSCGAEYVPRTASVRESRRMRPVPTAALTWSPSRCSMGTTTVDTARSPMMPLRSAIAIFAPSARPSAREASDRSGRRRRRSPRSAGVPAGRAHRCRRRRLPSVRSPAAATAAAAHREVTPPGGSGAPARRPCAQRRR